MGCKQNLLVTCELFGKMHGCGWLISARLLSQGIGFTPERMLNFWWNYSPFTVIPPFSKIIPQFRMFTPLLIYPITNTDINWLRTGIIDRLIMNFWQHHELQRQSFVGGKRLWHGGHCHGGCLARGRLSSCVSRSVWALRFPVTPSAAIATVGL